MDVVLVTYAELLELFPDDQPLAADLEASGLEVGVVAWDDPGFDWSRTRLALLRSPWDYYRRYAEFLAWAERAATMTRLANPLEVVRWNTHKGYLLELAARGAAVVPTALLRRGESSDLAALASERGWRDLVVKPAVSADSWETLFVPAADLARGQAHADRLLPERDLLVQPFLDSVESSGERCLVFLDGEFSHAVRKNALTQGGRWTGLPEGVPVEAEPDERAAADRVLAAAGWNGLLYARVDLTRDAAGAPLLLELELTEPTLFVADSDAGRSRLVGAIHRLVADERSRQGISG